MNPLLEKTEYFLVCGLIRFLKLFPECLTVSIFRLFGALIFIFAARRRRLTLTNLQIAFPEKSDSERFRIAWRAFLNMAEFTGDSFLLMAGKLTPEKIMARVDEGDVEKYRKLREPVKTGVIALTGHLGNWELLGNYAAIRGFPLRVIARKGTNQLIDEKIIIPMRTRFGNRIFYKENAMLNAVKALKRNETTSFLIDQKINIREGVPVQFFGQEVLAVASCATLQLRFNPLVVSSFMIKTGRRRYKWIISDPIEWIDDGSPQEEQIRKLTQLHQSVIEKTIRAYPDQWFWMHNRFRLADDRTRRRRGRRNLK